MYSKNKKKYDGTKISGYKIVGVSIIVIVVIASIFCLSQDNLLGAIVSIFTGVPTGIIIMIGSDILDTIKHKE